MTFILVDDEQRCNNCVYWTGKRKEDEDFEYVDLNSAEWGLCLCQKSVTCGKPTASCEGFSNCKRLDRIATSLSSSQRQGF